MQEEGASEMIRSIGIKFKDDAITGTDWLVCPMLFDYKDWWPTTSYVELTGIGKVEIKVWKISKTGKLFYREV